MRPILFFLASLLTLTASANIGSSIEIPKQIPAAPYGSGVIPNAPYAVAIYYDGAVNKALNGTDSSHRVYTKAAAATYPGGLIQNISHAVIDFTGSSNTATVNLSSLVDVQVIGLVHNGIPSIVWNWSGHSEFVLFDKNQYISCAGDIHEVTQARAYNGTQASLNLYHFRETNFYAEKSGKLMQGSWGGSQTSACFSDSVAFEYGYVLNTSYNGTLVRGIFFHGGFNYNKVIFNLNGGLNTVLGDVGQWYANGSLTMVGNLMWGGRGYDYRLWPTTLNGQTFKSQIFNNVHMNTQTYGGGNPAWDAANGVNTGTYTAVGGSVYVWNNTYANMSDNIGYWTPGLVVGGGIPAGTKVYYHFNLVLNALEGSNPQGTVYTADQSNKPKQVVDQSNGSLAAALDSGGNLYQKISTPYIDQTNGKKLIAISAGADVGTLPVIVPPVPTTCNYDSAIRVYLAAHPCPPTVVCPVIDTAKIIANYLAANPCPVPVQRKVISITYKGGQWIATYDDGTSAAF